MYLFLKCILINNTFLNSFPIMNPIMTEIMLRFLNLSCRIFPQCGKKRINSYWKKGFQSSRSGTGKKISNRGWCHQRSNAQVASFILWGAEKDFWSTTYFFKRNFKNVTLIDMFQYGLLPSWLAGTIKMKLGEGCTTLLVALTISLLSSAVNITANINRKNVLNLIVQKKYKCVQIKEKQEDGTGTFSVPL